MYLELLKTHTKDSKYTNWYIAIISNSKNRTLEGYVEKHHILPRSFKLGGEKDAANLVSLTAREHFICHRLLVKMMIDKKQKMKMQKAVWLLYKNLPRKGSRSYEYMRLKCTNESRELMRALWQDPEYIEKQAKATETKYKKPGYSEKRSELTKKQMSDPKQRAIAKNTFAKAHENIDHSSKEWVDRSFGSKESRQKISDYTKSDIGREKARQRELNKGPEKLSAIGKARAKAAQLKGIAKFGSIEAYKIHCSEIRKGRTRMINLNTLEIKNVKDPSLMSSEWLNLNSISIEERRELYAKKKRGLC